MIRRLGHRRCQATSTCAAARCWAPSRTNPTKSKADMDNVLTVFRELDVDALVTHRRRRHRLLGQPGLQAAAAAASAWPTCPRPSTTTCRCPARRPTFGFETARQVGVAHRPQPGRGRPHHLALVPDRQHGPGRRPSGPGHRQGRRRHADHHPRGVPRPGGDTRRGLRHPARLASSSARPTASATASAVLAEGLIEAIGEKGLAAAMAAGKLGATARSCATRTATCDWARSSSAA